MKEYDTNVNPLYMVCRRKWLFYEITVSSFSPHNPNSSQVKSKASWNQLIDVMALVYIEFLDLLNIGAVEFGLCELSRLME